MSVMSPKVGEVVVPVRIVIRTDREALRALVDAWDDSNHDESEGTPEFLEALDRARSLLAGSAA